LNYAAIMNALPKDVATILQNNLDDMDIDFLSPDIVHKLVVEAVDKTKAEMLVGSEVRGMVEMLLDQMPDAAVQVLCMS
jgi:hypothetical protein